MTIEPRQQFDEYIRSMGLKETSQRNLILKTFLSTDEHVSVDDIYRLLRRRKNSVGYATVSRTMKLISGCGLAREISFNDGIQRFEHIHGRTHHHHLICTACKKVIEFESKALNEGEKAIIKKYGFKHQFHHFKIFGICSDCRRKGKVE